MKSVVRLLLLGLYFTMSSVAAGEVSRAQFATAVVDREPVDNLNVLSNSQNQVSFFSELKGFSGMTITHQWLYQGEVMFEKGFAVGGPRWRVWSSKTLLPGWTGEWTVKVLDEQRNSLSETRFSYQ